MSARKLLEYGESREGYWKSEKFMKQLEYAVEVAEAKYPKEQGYRLFCGFLIRAAATVLTVMMRLMQIRLMPSQEASNRSCMTQCTMESHSL